MTDRQPDRTHRRSERASTRTAPARAETAGRKLRQLAELPVSTLRGVGGAVGRELAELGITTVLELLTHYPRRYVDGTRMVAVASLADGEKASVLARVLRVSSPPPRRGRGRRPPSRVEVDVADEGGRLRVVFFNQSWRARQLAPGTFVLLFGAVSSYRGALQMVNPAVEVLRGPSDDPEEDEPVRAGRVFPVYPLSERADLTSSRISRFVHEALDRSGHFADPVPADRLERLGLLDRTTAFEQIHRPATVDEPEPARRRLAFDELFRLQLDLVLRRRRLEEDARGIRHVVTRPDGSPTALDRFVAGLPFTLTPAQRRAIATITEDLAGPLPMHRLLQGDVGSGKTVVALAAMLVAVEGGHQGALMAPTEVLAEQHAGQVRSLLGDIWVEDPSVLGGRRPLRCALLTSKTPAKERASILEGLGNGDVDLLVGTHALLTDQVAFASLGVVVIDEQHRFGVEQRAALRAKGRGQSGEGRDPDLLVMTATPIPRTAAMVVFGDLDMTVVDELPPGRLPVATSWLRGPLEGEEAWARIRKECASGHRAFVVCPLVEGSGKVEASSVVAEAERLGKGELAGLEVGLLHGQMRPAEKERAMGDFRAGRVQVLVATTVIEVGVDVPEATVMVVEDADRFGIAQLHQLRGRVGRGTDPAWCYLLSGSDAPDAASRLSAVERTVDGFELAEADLELRGEGTILGERQKGRSDLRLARLGSDRDLVLAARDLAEDLVADDPSLLAHSLLADELSVFVDETEAEFLFKS